MLILSRKKGEFITIDLRGIGKGLIHIGVAAIQGNQARIGIEADRSIPVVRAHGRHGWPRKSLVRRPRSEP